MVILYFYTVFFMLPPALTRNELKAFREHYSNSPDVWALLAEIRRLQVLLIEIEHTLKYARTHQDVPYIAARELANVAVMLDREWFIRWDRAVKAKKKAEGPPPGRLPSYLPASGVQEPKRECDIPKPGYGSLVDKR